MKSEDKEKIRSFMKMLDASSAGLALVFSTFIGLGIGLFLDKTFKTPPLFTLTFLLLGIIAGFYSIFKIIKRK